MPEADLTSKERGFLKNLREGLPVVEAARRAGYAASTAKHDAGRIFQNIQRKLGDKLDGAGLTDDMLLAQLKALIEQREQPMAAVKALEVVLRIRGGFEASAEEIKTREAAQQLHEVFLHLHVRAEHDEALGIPPPLLHTHDDEGGPGA